MGGMAGRNAIIYGCFSGGNRRLRESTQQEEHSAGAGAWFPMYLLPAIYLHVKKRLYSYRLSGISVQRLFKQRFCICIYILVIIKPMDGIKWYLLHPLFYPFNFL